jgi:hypothetical protein
LVLVEYETAYVNWENTEVVGWSRSSATACRLGVPTRCTGDLPLAWDEFHGLLVTLGVHLTAYHVRQATKGCPPVKAHGAKCYEERHVQMAVGYAKAKGLARIEAPEPEEVTA